MMATFWKKWRWDGLGLGLAGLCLVHCLLATMFLVFLASAGGILVDPVVHEAGLFLAIILGALALGKGTADHRMVMPASIGGLGIGIMAWALTWPHGWQELLITVMGMALLALGHYLNHRALQ